MKYIPIFVLLALVGCSSADKAVAPAAANAPLAVAKGVVESQGGLVRVLAPAAGTIVTIEAEEGDHVAAGQVLVRLDDRQARLAADALSSDVAERRGQADGAQAQALGAAREARRLRELADADAAPRQDADLATTAAVAARGQARQTLNALRAAEARQKLGALDLERRTVRAPVAGHILRRSTTTGASTLAASPLFVLEPDGSRIVRAELDEAFADRVTASSKAEITRAFQAGETWRGRILRISDVLANPVQGEDAAARADARVTVVILTLPPNANLRLGQRVLVRFSR